MQKKYPFNYLGIHHCEAAVMCCIDFRFWRETVKFVEEELKIKDFDFPSLPGSAKTINDCLGDLELAMQCVNIPCDLHQAKKIVIVNHADCGAYGGAKKFNGDIEAEQEFHTQELKRAKTKVSAKYPDKEVFLVYAKIVDEGKNVEFLEIK